MQSYRIDKEEVAEHISPGPLIRFARVLIDREVFKDTPLCLAIFRFPPGQKGAKHSHDLEVEVYYGLQGRGEVEFLGNKYEIKPGVAVYIPPKAEHDTKNLSEREDFEFLTIFAPPVDLTNFRKWPIMEKKK
jgi:quercetin dioxygenase-like cupin family protein